MTSGVLLIAIGNTLRRDDGAGHELAARLEPLLRAAGIPVAVQHLHQLAPETAEAVAEASLTVFLDASVHAAAVEWTFLEAAGADPVLGHQMHPGTVLAIARELFGKAPPAFLLTIPGTDFHHGEGLSPETVARVEQACEYSRHIAGAYRRVSAGKTQ